MSISKDNLNQKNLITNDDELKELLKTQRTKIKVIGAGGAGNNTITRLSEAGIQGIETVAVNTDAQDLLFTKSDSKLIIGKNLTRGLGAGGDPQVGEQAAKESEAEIKSFLQGADMVFITCGLGGGTGTGSAPVIAEIARNLNALTISVVTMPFSDEGMIKEKNAASGLDRLRKSSDTVIVIQNDRLLDIVPDLAVNAAFKFTDEILVNAVNAVTGLVMNKGLINLDFADIKTVMKDGDTAMIGTGESESEDKIQEAIEKATQNQLLDIDIAGAQSALINIEGDESMSMAEARKVMISITGKLDPNARIIWGASINKELKGKIKIFIIATGLNSQKKLSDKSIAVDSASISTLDEKKKPNLRIENTKNYEQKTKNSAKKEIAGTALKASKNVFNQIFEDEIKGDMNILRESIKYLDGNKIDNKTLSNLKNACTGLKNSAQLYSNKGFEKFIKFVSDFFDQLLANKLKYSPRFLPLFNKIPQILEGMAAGYNVAVDDGNKIIKELSLLINQGSRETKKEGIKASPEKSLIKDTSMIVNNKIFIEKKDLENKLEMELN